MTKTRPAAQAAPSVDYVTLVAAYLLLAAAFYFSYAHVVAAVTAWGQEGVAAYGIAAMPEVTVFIGMRKLLAGQATRFVYFVLASAGAFTLAGNLHSAQHSIGGYVAAGWPAYSAITALVLSGVHGSRQPVEKARASQTRVTFERQSATQTVTPQAATPKSEGQTVTLVAEPVTPKPRTADPRPVTPKALPATGSPEVTSWLRVNWDPSKSLTAEVKHAAMIQTGASESTVKRSARAIKAELTTEN